MTVPLDPNNPFASVGKSLAIADRDSEIIKLHDYCEGLNRMNWVIASGKPYFVNKRMTPKGEQCFVDRRA